MKDSKGEQKIAALLKAANFVYQKEYHLSGRYHKLRLDFYLPDEQIAIEYQGEQHFQHIKHFHRGRQEFLKAKEYDRQKINWCNRNGIKLYIVPYWELEKINSTTDIFKNSNLAKTMYHNDEIYNIFIKEHK